MSAYLPSPDDLRALFATAITATGMVWGGRLLVGRRAAPETALLAGWGALCLVLTLWAVALPFTLYTPMACCFLLALLGCRTQGQVDGGIWRVALLTLPLWLAMLPSRPSQVDSWLNLLPNLAFLVDHGVLPADGGPPHHSFLPGAPYDMQFAAFAASLVSGGLAVNGLALFNLLLLCAAGLKLGRVVAGRDGLDDPLPLPPWSVAAGLLLAVPLNPGFVPRVFFAGYGEAPLAVTMMFAVALSAELLLAERRRAPSRLVLAALALTLAAAIDIKQSAPALVLPLGVCLLTLGLICPGLRPARWCALVAAAVSPSLMLYGAWRWFVSRHLPDGALTMLPRSAWQWGLLPGILRATGHAIVEKPVYFAILTAVFPACAMAWLRHAWSRAAIILALGAVLIAVFTAFLVFTYVAHFPANWALHAHSFFRYMSQLSLVAMLGLAHCLRAAAAAWLLRRGRGLRRRLGRVAVAAVVALPLALLPMLRFDLAPPQPALWDMARTAAPLIGQGEMLALVMPGDADDAVGSMLRGVLLFIRPRRMDLRFRAELTADEAALADAAMAGAHHALVTCTPTRLAGLSAGSGGLLEREGRSWHAVATWAIPSGLNERRFSAMLPHAPFCGMDAAPS